MKSQDNVPGLDLPAVDHFRPVDYANDATGEIVLALAIHSRHLRGLSTNRRATRRAACFRKPAEQTPQKRAAPDVPRRCNREKREARAHNRNVVDAMIHQIGADGVVAIQGKATFNSSLHRPRLATNTGFRIRKNSEQTSRRIPDFPALPPGALV